MPTKFLDSQTNRKGLQDTFSFGGGSNTIIATDDGASDYGYIIDAGGGDDNITGSDFDGGVPTAIPFDPRTETGDVLVGGDGSDFVIGGRGDDWIYGGNEDMTDGGKGKDPIVINTLYGDWDNLIVINGTADSGYDDRIFGGNGVDNNIYADNFGTLQIQSDATFVGGDDKIKGGDGLNSEFVYNNLTADTQGIFAVGTVNSTFRGGHDLIVGGSGVNVTNRMSGDTGSLGGVAVFIGGNDTLVSGAHAHDEMTGDSASGAAGSFTGGQDVFVFGLENGDDFITDFELGWDVINFQATGLIWMNLDTSGNGLLDDDDTHISGVAGGNTVIDLGTATGTAAAGVHVVRVLGKTGLDMNDFDFATVIDVDALLFS